ncbi:MAG: 7-cyano-7-deazaguanine synthase QueC [Candidatus Neomarinimicrobiota bacterium]|jgi:7-cyano-7-deazaguanine synthase|nr:7-cyano-7-deazaguanine synthase QueC [Candidatus Neomarinimicrobiota bacterium]MDD3965519.1 7-cyano-7-deazaguanine synthase QueC [Candidatus Neomarinimicrobiota bacterium]MDX9780586.1 7-cyano-7-deazaguanine synthase QueC [bacterium]
MIGATALLLFSGGQDSTTCLYWAKSQFSSVEAVFFHYEQRHRIEYESARKLAEMEKVHLHELQVPAFRQIGGSAMIEERRIETGANDLPNTFVPGRNIVFLGLAGSLAYKRGIHDLVTGVNDADYSGYPDCRSDFIAAMQESLSKGLDYPIHIHAPLQKLDKSGIWALSQELGVLEKVVEFSHTCYLGERGTRHPWGYGCGKCPACLLRKNGYKRFIDKNI